MSDKLPTVLLGVVGEDLKTLGFKLVRSKKWYVRVVDNRTEKYQLVVLDDKPGYRICPSVSVRFEEVEAIFHRTSGYEHEYQKDTPTVGIDLWSVYGTDGYQIPIKTDADVVAVASQVLRIFHEKAQSFFAQFSTLTAVDYVINDQPTNSCVHRIMPWLRCSTGAIVAKLVGRKDYDQLVSVYRGIVQKDSNGYYLPRFQLLLSDLAKSEVGKDPRPPY